MVKKSAEFLKISQKIDDSWRQVIDSDLFGAYQELNNSNVLEIRDGGKTDERLIPIQRYLRAVKELVS